MRPSWPGWASTMVADYIDRRADADMARPRSEHGGGASSTASPTRPGQPARQWPSDAPSAPAGTGTAPGAADSDADRPRRDPAERRPAWIAVAASVTVVAALAATLSTLPMRRDASDASARSSPNHDHGPRARPPRTRPPTRRQGRSQRRRPLCSQRVQPRRRAHHPHHRRWPAWHGTSAPPGLAGDDGRHGHNRAGRRRHAAARLPDRQRRHPRHHPRPGRPWATRPPTRVPTCTAWSTRWPERSAKGDLTRARCLRRLRIFLRGS